MGDFVLRTEHLGIQFGAHRAVHDVSLAFERNKFTTVLGPNGAGKTTLFNLISGLLSPSEGEIYFKERNITRDSPVDRVRSGLGRSFQLTNVFPKLSAEENIRLAAQSREHIGIKIFSDYRTFYSIKERTEAILERVLLTSRRNFPAIQLTHGEQRKLELGMVLALDPEVLLLDEPTAGMAIEEVPAMIDILKKTYATGTTIILIEHKMDLVKMLSDRLIILVNGSVIADGDPQSVSQDKTVLQAYLGGGVLDEYTTTR